MNWCKPEEVGTKEYGKRPKRIQILEDGRVFAKEARNWKIEGQKRRITRKKNTEDCGTSLKREDSWHKKGLWDLARERLLQDRGALPKEEGCSVRGYKATQEEKFLSSCLRKWKIWKKRRKVNKETREEVSRTGKKRRREGRVSTLFPKMPLRNSVMEKIRTVVGLRGVTVWVTPVVLSHCVSEVSSVVPVVTDVLGSPSSSVVVMSEALVSGSDW